MGVTGGEAEAIKLRPAEVRALSGSPKAILLDVRTPGEFEGSHINGAINVPLGTVEAQAERIVSATEGRQLVIICQSGGRARQAYARLAKAGVSGAAILDGGMNAWVSAGEQVDRAERTRWALERQVRLVAGSLVLVFVIASIWIPAARYLAGAIGAGLVIAAVTNTCMMGTLLAKLPYNRGSKTESDGAVDRISRAKSA
jgi:rhodanese-related sulfurtransferase